MPFDLDWRYLGGVGRADSPGEAGGHISVPGEPVPAKPDDRQIEFPMILVPEVLAHLRLQFAGQIVVEKAGKGPQTGRHDNRGIQKIGTGEDRLLPFFLGQPADLDGQGVILLGPCRDN